MQYIYTQDGIYVINKPASHSNPLQHLCVGDYFVIYKGPEDCPFLGAAIVGSIIESQSTYSTNRSLIKLGSLKGVMIHAFYYQNHDRSIPQQPEDEDDTVSRFRRWWELTNVHVDSSTVTNTSAQLNEPYSFDVTHGINKTIIEFMTLYLKTLNDKNKEFTENYFCIPLDAQRANQKAVIEKMIEMGVIEGELTFHPFKQKPHEDICLTFGEVPPGYHRADY